MQLTSIAPPRLTQARIKSIDVLRGLVMVIMALDHVRDFFHIAGFTDDPLNLQTTTPTLFFTRWVTHFCAPVFVFLSGTSIYLQSLRKTKADLSIFLIKRGLWLIFAEVAIVTLAMTFNPFYNVFILQVIWAIGISMVILGLLIHSPFGVILALGVVIVLGHNLLDGIEAAPGFIANVWWELAHRGGIRNYTTDRFLFIFYPFVPWTGLLLLGYCAGTFFAPTVSVVQRRNRLVLTGVALLLFFVVVRFINQYGDPSPWSSQKTDLLTALSFLKLQKYPPSLLYMCITIGPALLFLAAIEQVQHGLTSIMQTFGRTAFFYYIVHWFLIHSLATIVFFARGHSAQDVIKIATDNQIAFLFIVPGEGVDLAIVYLIWVAIIGALYPICRWYDAYKTSHKEQWWLSYL